MKHCFTFVRNCEIFDFIITGTPGPAHVKETNFERRLVTPPRSSTPVTRKEPNITWSSSRAPSTSTRPPGPEASTFSFIDFLSLKPRTHQLTGLPSFMIFFHTLAHFGASCGNVGTGGVGVGWGGGC